MSREIKFRAWDEIEEKYNNDTDIVMTLNGDYCVDKGWVKLFPKLTLEQYTGLKDKNGKEIYEGDIVNISDAPAVSGKDLVVKFDEFLMEEYNCNKMTGWMVQVINGEWCSSLADVISCCEVIGNVHENKELLGGEE